MANLLYILQLLWFANIWPYRGQRTERACIHFNAHAVQTMARKATMAHLPFPGVKSNLMSFNSFLAFLINQRQ